MRYSLDQCGLPRLKSGELCMSRNWVATLKALSLLPNGHANSARELADTAVKHGLSSWWNLYERWHRTPRALIKVRTVGRRYEITLTDLGWQLVRDGDFGRIY